jgi:hypothetical protein
VGVVKANEFLKKIFDKSTVKVENFAPFKIRELGWNIAEGRTDSHDFQIRYRIIPEELNKARYPIRLNIFWKTRVADERGFPPADELKLMHDFEDGILRTTELDATAILGAILTGRSEREFVFQVESKESFIAHLSSLPRKFPLEIYATTDPSWEYLTRIIEDF